MSWIKRTRASALLVSTVGVGSSAAVAALGMALLTTSVQGGVPATDSAAKPPKVVKLRYADVRDGSSPRFRLHGYARRALSLTFKARFRGKTATAGSRYEKSITDPKVKGTAKHPWVIRRKGGGRRVIKLVRRGLDKRGTAKVRVRVKGKGGVDSERLRIVRDECHQEPPFYPLECEVRP